MIIFVPPLRTIFGGRGDGSYLRVPLDHGDDCRFLQAEGTDHAKWHFSGARIAQDRRQPEGTEQIPDDFVKSTHDHLLGMLGPMVYKTPHRNTLGD
ncbi:hypothetical protein [Kibdelosporangium aridum]|uniref:hypothetical protein n=1 Tax=Kibdelosporangium aridum TaxID=2030 RepID=UPI0005240A01